MKPGGGKQKGAAFERKVCQELSLWVSKGKKKDLFWRSAMSGGRATLGRRKGVDLARQAGDITAVAPEGHALTNAFYIECKHVKDLRIQHFVLHAAGPLALFWRKAAHEAEEHGRAPLLIAKENGADVIVLAHDDELHMPARALVLVDTWWVAIHSYDVMLRRKFDRTITGQREQQ